MSINVLSHPLPVRIIEELRTQELTVGALKDILEISPAAASQQLSILRSHGIVVENRQGRNVYYHLWQPGRARWSMDGLKFIGPNQ
ncbi:MAG: metalloregulator ArsR/SmtB family transcription factor [Candidatus Obscuribacterales bacterium]|nr:metalloregulator ArsR/SmtB family transcription factor [Candidatus Obscuribacterales bacterium]